MVPGGGGEEGGGCVGSLGSRGRSAPWSVNSRCSSSLLPDTRSRLNTVAIWLAIVRCEVLRRSAISA